MFVCHCRAVTDRAIKDSIEAGASTLGELAERCGAGSRCGGCHLALRRLLTEAGPAEAVPAMACATCAA